MGLKEWSNNGSSQPLSSIIHIQKAMKRMTWEAIARLNVITIEESATYN